MIARYLIYLHQVKRNSRVKSSELLKIQRKRLRSTLRHAYERVPFYHRKFKRVGIKPDDIKSVEDLSKIPVTTRAEIQSCSLENLLTTSTSIGKCVRKMTSGSTGIPLTVVADSRSEDFRSALWSRALWEDGVRLGDRIAVIKDPHFFPKSQEWFERLVLFNRRFISVFENAERQMSSLESFKPDVIRGYPSSLAILADFCMKNPNGVRPRLVFTGAELLKKSDRKLISSVFGCDLLDFYSCTEFSLLMWECREHNGYHMNVDSTVLEFVKEGESVSPGESGEILCTDLINYAMPLLRYELGDVGVPVEDCCSCGIRLPLMKRLTGRTDDFLIALDGRRISPLVFGPFPFENMERIRQFRVIQERKDRIRFQLVLKGTFPNSEQIFGEAEKKLERLLGIGIHVDFDILDSIQRDPCGKLRKVISRVSPR